MRASNPRLAFYQECRAAFLVVARNFFCVSIFIPEESFIVFEKEALIQKEYWQRKQEIDKLSEDSCNPKSDEVLEMW